MQSVLRYFQFAEINLTIYKFNYTHNKLSSNELENEIFHIIRLKHFIIIECFACKKSDGD